MIINNQLALPEDQALLYTEKQKDIVMLEIQKHREFELTAPAYIVELKRAIDKKAIIEMMSSPIEMKKHNVLYYIPEKILDTFPKYLLKLIRYDLL